MKGTWAEYFTFKSFFFTINKKKIYIYLFEENFVCGGEERGKISTLSKRTLQG